MLDLDDFKHVNDTHGHLAGDEVLMKAASLMTQSLREVDIAARYGGEEFALILPDTPRLGAFVVADRIRKRVDEYFRRRKGGPAVTMSGGVATFPDDATDLEQLIKRADEGLYRAKAEGKNRVTVMSGERRHHPRVDVTHRVTVRTDGPAAAARAKNISEGGLLVSMGAAGPGGHSDRPHAAATWPGPGRRAGRGGAGRSPRVPRPDALRPRPALPGRARRYAPASPAAPDLRRLARTAGPGPLQWERAASRRCHRPHPDPLHHRGRLRARRPRATAPATPGAGPATSATSPDAATEPPLVRDIVLEGITAYPPRTVYRAIVLRPGGRLRRDPATYAADLERRYQARGYLGARVGAAWDAGRGVLTLRADEGRLRELDVTGVEGGAESQARALLALKTGEVLTEKDVRAGLRRLQDGSGGAFRLAGEPAYTVEALAEGVRLKVAVAPVHTGLRVRIQGPDLSPLRNRVEGLAPGAGVELTLFDQAALEHARVYARAAYGFKSHDTRFVLGAQRPFAGRRLVLGYEFHDLTDTDDAFRKYPVELTPGVVRVAAITEDYFRRRGTRPTPSCVRPRASTSVPPIVATASRACPSSPTIPSSSSSARHGSTRKSTRARGMPCSSPRAGQRAGRCTRARSRSATRS